jgi:hypothetical protein
VNENYFESFLLVNEPSVSGTEVRFLNSGRPGWPKYRAEDMGMFDLGTTRYGGDFDGTDQNSPHVQLLRMVGS